MIRLTPLAAVLGLAAVGELGMRSAMAHGAPRTTIGQLLTALTFYAGVCALVALSLTVAAGLLATDRILLAVRQRIWAQSAHRTLSLLAVVFLGLHILTEVASGRVSAIAAAVPFATGSMWLGLGPIAAYLVALVAWTGVIRARFAGGERPWLWRTLHAVAYACWPVALLHGLLGGRRPAVWVTASYLLLMLAVGVALVVRLLAERVRRARMRPQNGARATEAVHVFRQSHPARGRVIVEAPLSADFDVPTLVNLEAARSLRRPAGGRRRALTSDDFDAQHSAPLRRRAR